MIIPYALAFDSSGNLFVGNNGNTVGTTVSEFFPARRGHRQAAVVIRSSVESRPMSIGGTNNAAVAGINLTTPNWPRIHTTATGTVTIGDSHQTGNITFTAATPATTAGAASIVVSPPPARARSSSTTAAAARP